MPDVYKAKSTMRGHRRLLGRITFADQRNSDAIHNFVFLPLELGSMNVELCSCKVLPVSYVPLYEKVEEERNDVLS